MFKQVSNILNSDTWEKFKEGNHISLHYNKYGATTQLKITQHKKSQERIKILMQSGPIMKSINL